MSTSTLLGNCGFFNSYGDDRLYDASDFSEYLAGILVDGCFPNDTGFKVKPSPDALLTGAPKVVISAGKVYRGGLWAHNKVEFDLSLGTQQVAGAFKHLLYFCFDTNETPTGRKVTIEYLAGTPTVDPVMPANGAGKYYLPLAIIQNRITSNPILADITDTRTYAGVSSTLVTTPSLVDLAVTTPKLDDLAVTEPKLGPGSVTNPKVGIGAITMDRLSKSGFLHHYVVPASFTQEVAANVPEYVPSIQLVITPSVNCNVHVTGKMALELEEAGTPNLFACLYIKTAPATAIVQVPNSGTGQNRGRDSTTAQITVPIDSVIALSAGVTYTIYAGIQSSVSGTMTVRAASSITATLFPR